MEVTILLLHVQPLVPVQFAQTLRPFILLCNLLSVLRGGGCMTFIAGTPLGTSSEACFVRCVTLSTECV